MTKQLTNIVAAVSISCGSISCSSTITAEPWHPKLGRVDAAESEQKDAEAEASHDDDDSDDSEDADAGE